jgi:hypothetical protein
MSLNARPTQDFVSIKEVRDGIITLKDGGVRAIMMVSSINLSLKAYDEQQAIIMQFQSFLNSLDFPTQISLQSRRLDIRPYLMTLEKQMADQPEPLLKIQTREYMEFIRAFTDSNSIMTKQFFITVPYSTTELSSDSVVSSMFKKKSAPSAKTSEDVLFEEKRSQLEQRMGMIESGLGRIGLKVAPLDTEAVVELFYKIFNPGDTSTENAGMMGQ